LISGFEEVVEGPPSSVTQIWNNDLSASNTVPSAPTNLDALVNNNGVLLSWDAASDAQTPSAGLTYNIRVGTTPGGSQILSPNANTVTGKRRLPAMGNTQHRLHATITNLIPRTTYFWSVQTIDTAYEGSPFTPEESFIVPYPPPAITDWSAHLDGSFLLQFSGVAGSNYTLQVSTNLLNWIDRTNLMAGTNGIFNYVDEDTTNCPQRFYRLLVP
jgi:hypothetical protein